jgi:HD-GYP domain-containing protein (c-di-GMP phosphodiesterase class II)
MTDKAQGNDAGIQELGAEFTRLTASTLRKLETGNKGTGRYLHDKAANLFGWFNRFPQPLSLLERLRKHHPDSFTHSVNVCLFTVLQAEQIKLPPEDLREAALSGLLHDVGKLAVPTAVLDKEAPLTRQEAAKISVHSVAGARSLAAMPGLPRLVVVGIWEHHLHHDGRGGYPRPSRNRVPHPVSQMIALGDFYDSLTTPKPYRPEQPRDRVLRMMREREGRVFHPLLLKNFLGLVAPPG